MYSFNGDLNLNESKPPSAAPKSTQPKWNRVCVLVAQSWLTLCNTPWSVAHQTPLSMWFSRQEYWSGLPFPSPGDLPDPEIKPGSLYHLSYQQTRVTAVQIQLPDKAPGNSLPQAPVSWLLLILSFINWHLYNNESSHPETWYVFTYSGLWHHLK